MKELFASGRVVDLIITLMLVEGLVLVAYHRRTGRGVAPVDLLANFAAGICLLLALRASLAGLPWVWIALALFCALFGHLFDLSRRWSARRNFSAH